MSQIKERPILFSAPMVRAILDGRKTVTRRPVKPQPEVRMVDMIGPMLTFNKRGGHWLYPNAKQQIIEDCPFGKPGERLWVRETTEADQDRGDTVALSRYAADRAPVLYAGSEDPEYNGSAAHWDYPRRSRPSIHMERWACRILLEITDVRVERLQDISRADIRAEGLQCPPELASDDVSPNYRDWYPAAWKELWNSTGGDWDANPWVWVVEFKRVTP